MNGSRLQPTPPRRGARIALLLALLPVLTGCGDGKIRRYPVTGKVLVGEKPVEGARVLLVPVGGNEKFQKERPYGVTDQNGDFSLTTFQKGDGAPAGEYKVMIRQGRPKTPEEAKRRSQGPLVDRKYNKPATSGLTATIEPVENTLEPFTLEKPEKRGRR